MYANTLSMQRYDIHGWIMEFFLSGIQFPNCLSILLISILYLKLTIYVFHPTFSCAHRKNRGAPIDRCFVKNDFCERSEALKSFRLETSIVMGRRFFRSAIFLVRFFLKKMNVE